MRNSWLKLVESVLRPARPRLEECRDEADRVGRAIADTRARAVASCEARIEAARTAVFAHDDGVVTARMTDLEREWRRLSRADVDGQIMAVWARIAPASWIDRKRWRDDAPNTQLTTAVALAADVDGVQRAERALGNLRTALGHWNVKVGAHVRWRTFEQDFDGIEALLAVPMRAAREAVSARDGHALVFDHAERLESEVQTAVLARLPERTVLAKAIAHAALVDCVYGASALPAGDNPVSPLRALWQTGYVLSELCASSVTVAVPF